MPPPPTLKIIEIFASVQGEGLRQGEATIFVRMAGCNLRCAFCDTRYAWTGGTELSVGRVLDEIRRIQKRFPARWVCLTGGEPLLQDVEPLIRRLKQSRIKVQVETNATQFRPTRADWVTVSPKPKDYFCEPRFRRAAREVKLIVSKELTLATLRRLRNEFPVRIPILLQPESNAAWSKVKAVRLLKSGLRHGLKNIRLSLQLHKIFGLR
jgi:7-carboxy-7-deazaguanine synthase